MESARPLAPCFIGNGTISHPRDMVRALETLESLEYAYEVDGVVVAHGAATLVKLMADLESATMAVNGCLFLNVASFRYLDFESTEDGSCVVRLHGDGSVLVLQARPDADTGVTTGQMRLIEDAEFSLSEFVFAEDEEDED